MNVKDYSGTASDISQVFAGKKAPNRKEETRSSSEERQPAPLPRHSPGERFVKGPIPLDWLKAAASCGQRGEAVSLLMWYQAGLTRSNPVKLTPKVLGELKVHPKTARRILRRMQEVGLVNVEFRRGSSPVVTLLAQRKPTGADQ